LLGVRPQTHTLLGDNSVSVVLQVEQVPHVLGQVGEVEAELQASDVAHGLVALLPLGLLLITNREECKRCVSGDGKAALTECRASHVRHLLNRIVNVVADDGSPKWCCRVEGYHHPDLTCTQVVGLKGTAKVSRNRPIVAKSNRAHKSSHGNPGQCRHVAGCSHTHHVYSGGSHPSSSGKYSHETIANPKVINSEK
jgi:hypothetical protein